VGLLHALYAAQHAAVQPLLHLRTLNPYVQGALFRSGSFMLPRQVVPCAATGNQHIVTGVSSFAFQVRVGHLIFCFLPAIVLQPPRTPAHPHKQGTNAHLVLKVRQCQINAAAICDSSPSLMWMPARYWPAAPVNPLLLSVVQPPMIGLQGAVYPAVRFAARLTAPINASVLSNRRAQNGTVVLPVAANLMLVSAAVDACSLTFNTTAEPQIVLTGVTIEERLMLPSEAVGLEMVLEHTGDTRVISASGQLFMTATIAQVPDAKLQPSGYCQRSHAGASAPAFLAELAAIWQRQYDQAPGPISIAQVAASYHDTEPAVATVLQLEASMLLPQLAPVEVMAAPALPVALEACIICPRGFGLAAELDLVDPPTPILPRGVISTANLWLRSKGSVRMQLSGVAYRPLAADVLVPQRQPAALLTAATTQVLDLPSTSSTGLQTVSAPGLSYTCTWLATSRVELCSHGSARPDTAPHLMLKVGPSCNALDVLKNMLPVLHFTAAVDHTTGLAVSSFGAYSYVAASGLTGANNSTPISSAARAAAAAGWGSLRSAVLEVPDLSLAARDFSASDTTAPHVHVLMELNRTATGIRDELATPAELHLYGNTTVAGVIHTAQLTRLHHSMATWPPQVTGGILSETERRGTFIVTGISITCLAHQLLWNIIGSAQHSD
jgi:hypothetical protein